MLRPLILAAVVITAAGSPVAIAAQERVRSLDLTIDGNGISIGDSRRVNGLRINFRDTRLEQVNGVNITVWNPTKTSHGIVNGAAIGVPTTGADEINGLAAGIFGLGVEKRLRGIGVGGIGMGAGGSLEGIMIGGIGVGSGGDVTGITIGGIGVGSGGRITGLSIGGIGVGGGGGVRGISIGGVGVGSGGDVTGLSIGGVGVGAGGRLRGVQIGGVGVGAPRIEGITLAIGAAGGENIRGLTVAGGYVRVERGTIEGVTASAFNHIKGRQHGLAIGIVNYAWELSGVQIGVLNYARNNPPPFRLLPIINVNTR